MSTLDDLAKIYQSRRVARDVLSGLRKPIRFEECWWWDIGRIEHVDAQPLCEKARKPQIIGDAMATYREGNGC
jgi:hypothetical protein